MALKQTHTFFHAVEDKVYQFTVESDTSLSHLKEVFFHWLKDVGNIEDSVEAQKSFKVEPIAESPTDEKVS